MDFQVTARKIREQRDLQLTKTLLPITKYLQKMNESKIQKIVNSTVTELAEMLNKGEATSVELVHIFARRAGTIGNQLKAITDQNFTQAIRIAQLCDQKRKKQGLKNKNIFKNNDGNASPLFGIPLSIKDTIDMKGFASTIGCVARYDDKQQKDGQIVTVLKTAGMIPFVRSNVPQLCMNYECNNLLWGKTENPWDRKRTPGGSSGGEGALVSSRCSPMGLGGDIGGSLRIPAEFCGVYTLKSTSQRITSGGHTFFSPTIDGQVNIKSTMGPMTRCVEDLALFLDTIMNKEYYSLETLDPYKKLEPFDVKVYKYIFEQKFKGLKIGYYDSFDLFPSTKASKRAVHQVLEILRNKGFDIVPITIPRVEEITKVLVSVMVAEGGLQGYQQILEGEPLSQQYKMTKLTLKFPKFVHWAACKVLQKFIPRMAFALSEVKKLSTSQYLELSSLQKQLKQQFIQMWKKQKLDFMIGPGFGTQAPLIGQSNKMSFLPSMYANIWNVLDMTVGSLPVTVVKKQEEKYQCKYSDLYAKATQKNMQGTQGLPVGVQIISLPYYDEQVLGLMKIIENEVKFNQTHSYPI